MNSLERDNRERAIIVGMVHPDDNRWNIQDYLDELELLADTAGATVLDRVIQERERIDPAYFIGKGKAKLVAGLAKQLNADLIIFDDDLSPAQIRNWERLSNAKILDRSGLILDIFARRARTREAKTQVELAQLKYLLPRLTRRWTHLSRQVGGIGTRGPGETQLEVDRRIVKNRIRILTKELDKIQSQRSIRRKRREDIFKVALMGYTNVGKSTLLNTLTQSEVFVEDRLFATLDSTVRSLDLANHRKILLIDTVGFIRKLPHHLVASFKSTLEEAAVGDLLLHIVDVSHPQWIEQMTTVKDVLRELNISHKPTLLVFNKIDKLKEKGLIPRIRHEYAPCVLISASRGIFLEELKEEILRYANEDIVETKVEVDLNRPKLISHIYDLVEVLERSYTNSKVVIRFRSGKKRAEKIRYMVEENYGVKDTGS